MTVAAEGGSPIKVCYLLKRFPRLSQTFVLNEILELERQGVAITVVAARGSGDEVTHERLAELRGSIRYLEGDRDVAGAVAAVREAGVAHIHAHFATWGADTARRVAAETGVPYSFTAHARDIYRDDVDPAALTERIADAAFVVTVSDANRRYLQELLELHGRTGTVVRLYNGLDLSRAPTSGVRDPDLIVSVGRLVPKKGFADLIEACRLLHAGGRAARVAIIGDGELRGALQAQVTRAGLGGHVSLLGSRSPGEALALISRGTVFALPCLVAPDGDRDGLPTVILEAMALGTPVVSTDLPGVDEMIRDGVEGRLVPQRDPEALAGALEELLAGPERRAEYAARALDAAGQKFDLRSNVAELARLICGSVPSQRA